jgi:hypothetical protein
VAAAVITIAVAGTALAAAGPSTNSVGIDVGPPKGKVRTDGVLTVGQPEKAIVKGPPRVRFKVEIGVPITTPGCDDFKAGPVCLPANAYPAPATAPFRTSRKGRAKISMVVPSTYELFNFRDPTASHPVDFVNGQTIVVLVLGIRVERTPDSRTVTEFSLADALATVEVPAVTPPTP